MSLSSIANTSSLSNARCLVTGGAGFIGSHVAVGLLDSGARVRVLDNLSTGFETNLEPMRSHPNASRFEFVSGDAADADVIQGAVQGVDHVFHLAAMASVPRSMREPTRCHHWTTTSTIQLLEHGAAAGVKRLVLSSTSAAYGNSPFVSKRESDAPMPLSPYAASKLASEGYCEAFAREFEIEPVILRYFNVYGPRQDPQSEYSAVIPRFVSMILNGEEPIIYGDGHQSRDFVYVADVVQANLLAATVPGVAGQRFNVARGEQATLLHLLSTLSDLLERPIEPIHEPPRAGDVRQSLADITAIRNGLGFEPQVSLKEGLRESISYYESICQAH
ncbi:MAG: SDR family oxidoreductase [Planctomycetota bacterium]